MDYLEPRHRLVLAGQDADGKPAQYGKRDRVGAAWAQAHNLAEPAFGQAASFFGSDAGVALANALQAAPEDATCEQLLQTAAAHIEAERARRAERKKKQAEPPQPGPAA